MTRNVNQRLAELVRMLGEQIADLSAMHAEFARRPELRQSQGYLSNWFPSRVEALTQHHATLQRLYQAAPAQVGPELVHALGWFQSLGQAFDVDLGWAAVGRRVFVRLGEMQRLAIALRAEIRLMMSDGQQLNARNR